jgi:predicted DCC family thiol-disulfide oxidoreductase YuxK
MTEAVTETAKTDPPKARYPYVVFYDGVCGFCNWMVRFILKRDRRGVFRFSPLQGALASQVLPRHGKDPADLDAVFLAIDANGPEERLLDQGRASMRVLRELGGVWRIVSWLGILPTPILNWGYQLVARRRYRFFGKLESCPIPSPEERERFLGF